jgi:DNA polymerase I
MRNHVFEENDSYPIAILIKPTAFKKADLIRYYVEPLQERGISQNQMFAMTLEYDGEKKVKSAFLKQYVSNLLPELRAVGVKYMLVADSEYFKYLAKKSSAEPHHGYALPCGIKGYEDMFVVLSVNHQAIIYDPKLQDKLNVSLNVIAKHNQGTYIAPGTSIIKKAIYPVGFEKIKYCLEKLMNYPVLTADIEAFSLRFYEAGIGTFALAPDQHNFVAFPCDYKELEIVTENRQYGEFVVNPEIRNLLKWFLINYQGKLIWHNTGYDLKVLIYTLWMKNLGDTEGLLEGLEVMTRLVEDTKIIAYLATNSTSGNVLGLKPLSQEFSGNYAVEDIKDIRFIPLKDLLQYNGVDCLSTWYVYNKYRPIMVQDSQEELYYSIMLPSQKLIHQIELTGMPMNKSKIHWLKTRLTRISNVFHAKIRQSPRIPEFEELMTDRTWEKEYLARRNKAKNPEKILRKDRATFPQFVFNPGSAQQLQYLLYTLMQLPVLDYTDTKQPATGEKTLEKLINHVKTEEDKNLIKSLIGVSQVSTILSTFIPAFERGVAKTDDGIIWLFGNFNIGGTVSGRLSSSDPNMQNIPAKSIFAKLIKACFMAPDGWLFCGADFNSLEDMISALTTKDPNKLKVYTDGFDGHCLRAVYYFRDELIAEGINIDESDPKSVNQLKSKAYGPDGHPLRQKSKTPTFALTYQGTHHTLMANLGWTAETAMAVEKAYHDLYRVSDEYIQGKIIQASKDGYGIVAFGLRVRTPLLGQVVYGAPGMPYEAAAEARTLGNAFGQSWGLLNNRAMVAFMEKVWKSPYRLDILPCSLIHDAGYLLLRKKLDVVEWANKNYIKEMQWQDHPEIEHPSVKLGAALDIFWPSWANAITLPNDADKATIKEICNKGVEAYLKPKESK